MKTYKCYEKTLPLRKNPVKVIRQFCWQCMGWMLTDIEGCTSPECPLYPWRFGKNPYRKEKTKEQVEASRKLCLTHGFVSRKRKQG